jgi:hypothetical protein
MLIDSSMSREAWQSHLIRSPTTVEYLQACMAAHLDSSWVRAGLASKTPVEVLQTLKAMNVPRRYVPCALRVCKSGTAVDRDAARRWYIAGVSPLPATEFIRAQVGTEVALSWLRAGFLAEEAISQIQSGICLESARLNAAKIKFSKAFRRKGPRDFSIRREFELRVQNAVRVLDVPSGGYGGMFASSARRVAFLDGGYVAVEGYGFGSHSYTCIIGEQALLLICHRIGALLPRGTSPSPSAEDLESMLSDQRLNHWGDLVAQAQAPGFIVKSEMSG